MLHLFASLLFCAYKCRSGIAGSFSNFIFIFLMDCIPYIPVAKLVIFPPAIHRHPNFSTFWTTHYFQFSFCVCFFDSSHQNWFLKLLTFFCGLAYSLCWRMFHMYYKTVCTLAFVGWSVLYMSVSYNCFAALHKSSLFLLLFYLLAVSVIASQLSKSLTPIAKVFLHKIMSQLDSYILKLWC